MNSIKSTEKLAAGTTIYDQSGCRHLFEFVPKKNTVKWNLATDIRAGSAMKRADGETSDGI